MTEETREIIDALRDGKGKDAAKNILDAYHAMLCAQYADLRALREENERLKEAGVGYSQQTVDAITKEREALREALERYGCHKNGCNYINSYEGNPKPCTCGLDAAKEGR